MSDDDWLFDYILAFLKSPPWTVPISTFIDENCLVFDNEEENKLAYTEIHKQFIEMIDGLLESNLAELGVTQQQFVAACEKGMNNDVNRQIFDQILAVDDFLSFKKMMVAKNMELEREVLESFARQDLNASSSSPSPSGSVPSGSVPAGRALSAAEQEQREIELAIQLSQQEGAANPAQAEHDAELEAALRASMMEADLAKNAMERERAELEHALAMSLALEAEKDRQLKEAAAAAEAAAEAARQAEEEQKRKEEEVRQAQAAADAEKAKAAAEAAARAKAEAEKMAALEKRRLEEMEAAKARAKKLEEENKAKAAAVARNESSSSSASSTVSSFPPVTGNSSKPRLEISEEVILSQQKVRADAVNQIFARNRDQAAREKKADIAELKSKANVSESELARRRAFMLKQRELILARKKKKRQAELKQFNSEKKASSSASGPSSTANLPRHIPDAGSAADITVKEQPTVDRREQMRLALAKRLKADMLAAERRRAAQAADANFNDLNSKLAEADRMRELQLAKEAEQRKLLIEQEKQRQEQMAQFRQNMAASKLQGDGF